MDDTAITFAYPPEYGLVSVIVPTYNRAAILLRAIHSALGQTYPQLEVVVVDDGSTDESREAVASLDARVRYLYQPNAGVAAARNTGIASAKGEFIAFLDSDDAWHPWKIAAEVAALRCHPSVGLVWTDMSAIDSVGRVVHQRYLRKMYGAYNDVNIETIMLNVGVLGDLLPEVAAEWQNAPVRVGDLSNEILLGNLLHTSTVLYRRSWVNMVGGFVPSYRNGCEDYEYYTRLCALGRVLLIDAPSTLYRIGGEDQLTAPEKLLWIAQKNLTTIQRRFAERGTTLTLSPAVIRRRVAWSLAWVGSTEFEAGHRRLAARHLAASLRMRPGLDRRVALLACCLLPKAAVDGLRALRDVGRRPGVGHQVGNGS